MKENLLIITVILICSHQVFAQKASEVLEKGEPVKKENRLFLKYDVTDKSMKSRIALSDPHRTFITHNDSIIYLVREDELTVFLKPLNPLNYSYNTETTLIIDPINETAATALGSIIEMLGTVAQKKTNLKDRTKEDNSSNCTEFKSIQDSIEDIQKKLLKSNKDDVAKIFEFLKGISFDDEKSTIVDIDTAKKSMETITNYLKGIETSISNIKIKIKDYPCTYPDSFTAKFVFNSILKEFSSKVEEQKKRLLNLKIAYDLVESMVKKAAKDGEWCIPLKAAVVRKDKILIYTITIKENGYKLSVDNEIISIQPKELIKSNFRTRKFQRFIPEVSVGTAFTFLNYYSYGTTSDSTGQQYVGSPTENVVKNLNITTMLNFNYYIENSPLHPFYQLGLGINSGLPTFLTGFGLRSSINGIKRLAIGGGIAMTWIKELDRLKVGDKIKGTEDIEKDYKFGSAPQFTPYVALQYNF
ncbi:MAG: hypothetical protein V4538_14035 [Bacteroidota bacterium]